MFESPIGFPVLVHAQVGESLKVFCGLALRHEDEYSPGSRYKGRISIVRVSGSWGQNEQLEIHHGIEHFSKRVSAIYWVYPDEVSIMYHDFAKSWDREEKQKAVEEISRRLTMVAVDWAKPGSERTVIAKFENGELVSERVIPASH